MRPTYEARKDGAEKLRHKAFAKRIELGMTIIEFSKHIGVSPSYYIDIENGHKVPSMKMMDKIWTAIGGQKNE